MVHSVNKTILTLRHSATDAAKRHVILGRIDQGLNDEGEQLINDLLRQHGPISSDHTLSSPLRRAMRTACAVTGSDSKDIMANPLCIERDYGRLQGIEPGQIPNVSPKTYYVSVNGIRHSLNPPGGETLEDVRRRADVFLRFLLDLTGTVLVVSHQCFLTQLHGAIRGEDVYNALSYDVGILDLDRFEIHDGKLLNHELLYSSSSSDYRSW
jgi:broad specificity phosphatase PhoE